MFSEARNNDVDFDFFALIQTNIPKVQKTILQISSKYCFFSTTHTHFNQITFVSLQTELIIMWWNKIWWKAGRQKRRGNSDSSLTHKISVYIWLQWCLDHRGFSFITNLNLNSCSIGVFLLSPVSGKQTKLAINFFKENQEGAMHKFTFASHTEYILLFAWTKLYNIHIHISLEYTHILIVQAQNFKSSSF